ncbi:MAG: hypothetical protein OXH98_02115 [Caldilineaceae bacterium]|nr:hypothetical protein [Caldilineaceae bacterium]
MPLQEGSRYSISQVSEFDFAPGELLAELGYRYLEAPLPLPSAAQLHSAPQLGELRAQMLRRLPRVPLTSMGARRALYVIPLLFAALDQAGFRMYIDLPVAGGRLWGTVDYLLRGARDVVVAIAENAHTETGFSQLAAQMVAVSEQAPQQLRPIHAQRARKAERAERARSESFEPKRSVCSQIQVFGAVTNGALWRFAILERTSRTFTQDTSTFHLPGDLEHLLSLIVALTGVVAQKKSGSAPT